LIGSPVEDFVIRVSTFSILVFVGLLFYFAAAISPTFGEAASAAGAQRQIVHELIRLHSEHLPNMVQVHPKVISGGLPQSDQAFKELADLGVKTIISVDGATPDVDAAKRSGLMYVHLPHGYDGIPDGRVKELAKAVRDLPGTIYIHCHHGNHRSPAATSVACVSAGLIAPTQAIRILEFAGTDPHYRGLYRSARAATALTPQMLDRLDVKFQAVCEVPAMAESMVQLSQTHENLKRLAESGWMPPESHPDLDAVHEALMLKEHFTELQRTADVRRQPADFQTWLQNSETAAHNIERTLRKWHAAQGQNAAPEVLNTYVNQITSACRSCHAAYRDVPAAVGR